MAAENQERRSKFFAFLSRVRSSGSTNVSSQKDKRGTPQKHRRAYSLSTRSKPLRLGEGRAEEHVPINKFSISSPIRRSPISLTGFDNDDIDSFASSGVGVHNTGRRAGSTSSEIDRPKFQRPYHNCSSGTSLRSSKSAVTRAGSRIYHLPFHSYSSHEQQPDTPGSPYQNQGFATSGTTLSSNSRPQTPYDDLDDHELPRTTVPEFGEIGIAIGSEEELDGMISCLSEEQAQYSSLYASERSEPPRKPYRPSYDSGFTPPPISRQLVTSEVDADVLSSSASSPLLSLLRFLRKKASAPISTVVTEMTMSLMYDILDLEHQVELASELSSASDAELLLDFALYLIENRCLSDVVVQGANRKARRLMCKLMAKTPVMPRSLFMTGVDAKMSSNRIGMGGFGCVFEGKHQGKRVALKVLYKVRRDDDFVREALVWRSLSHPFILSLLGIYEEQSLYFLVSPFMKNGTLAHWRNNQNPLPTEIEMRVREVAEGVWYIHSEGIVHGDLRGANILLDDNFHCKIADFGLARHSDITVTRSTTALSFNFAAPELLGACSICNQSDEEGNCPGCGNNGTQRPRKTPETDVYGFGCLYYEVFFDHIPFKGMGEAQIIRSITTGKHPPRLQDPRLEDVAWNLIARCWAMEPRNRPTMADVLNVMMMPGRQLIYEAF